MMTIALATALVVGVLLVAQSIEQRVAQGPVRRFVPILERFAAGLVMLVLVSLGAALLASEGPPSVVQLVGELAR